MTDRTTTRTRLVPLSTACLLATMAVATSPLRHARAQERLEGLEAQLAVERLLLEQDFEAYGDARLSEQQSLERLGRVSDRFADLLEEGNLTLEEVASLEEDLHASREAARGAGRRVSELGRRILERWRRVLTILSEIESQRETRLTSLDPLDGKWEVQLLPTAQMGVFDLELEGSLVSGTYELDGGFRGSLRGTYIGNLLTLERIDSERGFDVIFEARLDPGDVRMTGDWTATQLAAGTPSGGTWIAERLPPEEGPSR